MKLEQAIKTAMQYETTIRNIYMTAAQKSRDPVGQKVFGLLAREEREHLELLEKLLMEWTDSQKLSPVELRSAVPSKEAVQKSTKEARSKLADADRDHELELLNKALELEKETSGFYREMVNQLDAQGQALFEPFVACEDGHLGLVQAEIDSLTGLGYYFDMQEFNLEAG